MENFFGPWTREELRQDDTFAYPTPLAVKQWLATEDVGTFVAYAHDKLGSGGEDVYGKLVVKVV